MIKWKINALHRFCHSLTRQIGLQFFLIQKNLMPDYQDQLNKFLWKLILVSDLSQPVNMSCFKKLFWIWLIVCLKNFCISEAGCFKSNEIFDFFNKIKLNCRPKWNSNLRKSLATQILCTWNTLCVVWGSLGVEFTNCPPTSLIPIELKKWV